MSKEEAERRRESAASVRQSGEKRQSRSSSVERTMQVAEKEAAKDVSVTHPRTLATVWDPADAAGPGPTSTLPIVDEAGEASSVGGHSSHSRNGRPGTGTNKELPPPPPDESHYSNKGKQVDRMEAPTHSPPRW